MAFGRSDKAVSIAFEGKDEVSPVVRGIRNSMDGFKRDAKQGFGLAAGFNVATTAINLGVGAIQGAIGAAMNASRAYSDLNEAVTKNGEVFGGASIVVEEWAKGAAELFGMAQSEAIDAAASVGNFMQSLGVGRTEALEMSMGITRLSGDLASFNNVAGGAAEVMVNLRSGLAGEAEPMRRLGVDVSAAAVAAKALELGLAATKSEITESMKVQARYAIIMEQTASAQGDFARTLDGSANQARLFDAKVENLNASIGSVVNGLVRVVQSIGIGLVDAIGAAGGALDEFTGKASENRWVAEGLADAYYAAADAFPDDPQAVDRIMERVKVLQQEELAWGDLTDKLDQYGMSAMEQLKIENAIKMAFAAGEGSIPELVDDLMREIASGIGAGALEPSLFAQQSGQPRQESINYALEAAFGDPEDWGKTAEELGREAAAASVDPLTQAFIDQAIQEEQNATGGITAAGEEAGIWLRASFVDGLTAAVRAPAGTDESKFQGAMSEMFTDYTELGASTVEGLFGGSSGIFKDGKNTIMRGMQKQIRQQRKDIRKLIARPGFYKRLQDLVNEQREWLNRKIATNPDNKGLQIFAGLKLKDADIDSAGLESAGLQAGGDIAGALASGSTASLQEKAPWLLAMMTSQGQDFALPDTTTQVKVDDSQWVAFKNSLNTSYTASVVVTGAKKRAKGGPVAPGETYLVGEKGPELLTMGSGQAGYVTPNHRLNSGGGGGVVVLDGRVVGQIVDERLGRGLVHRAGYASENVRST